jgi:hypothetical protein
MRGEGARVVSQITHHVKFPPEVNHFTFQYFTCTNNHLNDKINRYEMFNLVKGNYQIFTTQKRQWLGTQKPNQKREDLRR